MSILYDDLLSHRGAFHGLGYIGGDLPPVPNPDEYDGRAKLMNEPGRVKVVLFNRHDFKPVAGTISSSVTGQWRIERLNPDFAYLVLGLDERGLVNAAVQDWVYPHLAA